MQSRIGGYLLYDGLVEVVGLFILSDVVVEIGEFAAVGKFQTGIVNCVVGYSLMGLCLAIVQLGQDLFGLV